MAIEVNGHVWETDMVRTRRYRDVLCLKCVNCGKGTQVPMRSKNREQYLMKQAPCPKPATPPTPETDLRTAPVTMGTMVPSTACPLCPPGERTCKH